MSTVKLHTLCAIILLAASIGAAQAFAAERGKKAPAAAAAAAKAPAAQGDLAPLDIKLPKPIFVGTPRNIVSANLEKAVPGKRAPFLAPKGTVNLALDKPVTSSDKEPIVGDMTLVTNGISEGADGNYVELGPGVQYVQIDLGAVSEIYAIVVWHFHAQAQAYKDVVVKTANDPDFILNVKTVFNNDHDNSAGLGVGKDKEFIDTYEGRLIDAKGVKGRYVRLYSNGNTANDMNHYIEVEVYGKPAGADAKPAAKPAAAKR